MQTECLYRSTHLAKIGNFKVIQCISRYSTFMPKRQCLYFTIEGSLLPSSDIQSRNVFNLEGCIEYTNNCILIGQRFYLFHYTQLIIITFWKLIIKRTLDLADISSWHSERNAHCHFLLHLFGLDLSHKSTKSSKTLHLTHCNGLFEYQSTIASWKSASSQVQF